jgi:hypothetical protein
MAMRITAIIVAIALGGCGLATGYQIGHMAPDELTKLTDVDVCHPYTGNHSPTLEAERKRRDLADCSQEHLYCHNMGLKTGTDAYVQCRVAAAQIATSNQAANQAAWLALSQQGFATAAGQPSVTTNTNCNTFGNTVNCTSTQH